MGLVSFCVWPSPPSLQPWSGSSQQAQGGVQEGHEPAVLACFPFASWGPLNEAVLILPKEVKVSQWASVSWNSRHEANPTLA